MEIPRRQKSCKFKKGWRVAICLSQGNRTMPSAKLLVFLGLLIWILLSYLGDKRLDPGPEAAV